MFPDFVHKIWPLLKNSEPNPQTFPFLVGGGGGTLDPNSQVRAWFPQ